MRKLILIISLLIGISALTYWVFTHENINKINRLTHELDQLQAENENLQQQNENLKRRIRALKDDPRIAERRARQDAGLARDNETIFQFVGKDKPQTVAVILKINNKTASLAGQSVDEKSLARELDKIKKQIPGASLKIQIDKDLDPIRKQIFQDIIQKNNFQILK